MVDVPTLVRYNRYSDQNEMHAGWETVYEAVLLAAKLILGTTKPIQEKEQRKMETLEMLVLDKYGDGLVNSLAKYRFFYYKLSKVMIANSTFICYATKLLYINKTIYMISHISFSRYPFLITILILNQNGFWPECYIDFNLKVEINVQFTPKFHDR